MAESAGAIHVKPMIVEQKNGAEIATTDAKLATTMSLKQDVHKINLY